MSVVVPEEIVRATGLSEAELQLEIALWLFEKERLTLGQASRLAGMSQLDFQRQLAQRGISLHYGVAEFEEDLRTLAELRRK
jgi:predicted HTH domain antitoxin